MGFGGTICKKEMNLFEFKFVNKEKHKPSHEAFSSIVPDLFEL